MLFSLTHTLVYWTFYWFQRSTFWCVCHHWFLFALHFPVCDVPLLISGLSLSQQTWMCFCRIIFLCRISLSSLSDFLVLYPCVCFHVCVCVHISEIGRVILQWGAAKTTRQQQERYCKSMWLSLWSPTQSAPPHPSLFKSPPLLPNLPTFFTPSHPSSLEMDYPDLLLSSLPPTFLYGKPLSSQSNSLPLSCPPPSLNPRSPEQSIVLKLPPPSLPVEFCGGTFHRPQQRHCGDSMRWWHPP